MRAAILVPFRPDGGIRSDNWSDVKQFWCNRFWGDTGITLIDADNTGDFSRSAALNIASKLAGDWDVAIVTDADMKLGSWPQAEEALETAYRTGRYTAAHSIRYYSSSPEAVESWESPFAVRRDIWDRCRGFDERFVGYGYQGIAFYYAAATFGGRARVSGPSFHLDHPAVLERPNFHENRKLCDRYLNAEGNPSKMDELIAERS